MTTTMGGTARRQSVCHLLVLLSLFAFQSLHLDSDSSPLKPIRDFNDEGFWNHAARCKVLFGTFVPDEFNQGVIAAPLFTFIQRSVFSLAGVSLCTARLQPLVGFWLIILMVYFLMRRHTSANMALLTALMLGLFHEMLMYVQWSTPIITEACFLVAVFFFWELARTGSQWWAAAAGAALVAAALTTILALHCVPGILLFFGLAVFFRKEADRRRLALFLGAASLLAVLAATLYYLPNYQQVKIFLATIGKDNIERFSYASDIRRESRLTVAFLEPFGSPGAATLMMILSLWLLDFVARVFKEGVRAVLRQMSSLELYCACWVAGALPSIVATPQMPCRRLVILLVPCVVIAALFTWRVWNARPDGRGMFPSPAANLPDSQGRIVLWGAVTAIWFEYVNRMLAVLDGRWLHWTSFGISPTPFVLECVLVVAGAIVAAMAGICVLSKKMRLSLLILLTCFFATNVALDLIWCTHATYTIRDKSRELGRRHEPGQYFLDGWSWELSLENRCLPLYSPWFWYGKNINAWFLEKSDRASFLLARHDQLDGCVLRQDLLSYDFPRERASKLEEIKLCPVIFAPSQYRYTGSIYLIRPLPPPRGGVQFTLPKKSDLTSKQIQTISLSESSVEWTGLALNSSAGDQAD